VAEQSNYLAEGLNPVT